jgi:threonine/homoserine/homoserine lactone efflux protein
MDAITFAITVIILTTSGALAPGPLFFVTISHGIKSGTKSGIIFSITHSLIEFSLVFLLALGLLSIANQPAIKLVVGLAGGAVLVVFGVFQVRSSFLIKTNNTESERGAIGKLFLIGLALTGLNPYFVIWWLTIGANLILLSMEFAGLGGVLFMYICHVWVDYVWLILLSTLAKKGNRILKHKWYRLLIAIFGIILIFFGFSFIIDSFTF